MTKLELTTSNSFRLTFCVFLMTYSIVSLAQTNGIPFTAQYEVTVEKTQILEKDKAGNMTKSINIAPGKGQHSILGDVSTMSIVHIDVATGDNIIEFSETDSEGNTLFVTTKGIPAGDNKWECYGAILGGTGKYSTATGHYKAMGTTQGLSSTFSAEGVLYYHSKEGEEDAIKQVIIDETEAYVSADNDKGKALLSFPYTNIVNLPQDEAIMTRMNTSEEDLYETAPFQLENIIRTDWDIQLRQHVAWVTFKQTAETMGSKVLTLETRILEKEGESWKIAHMQTMLDYANTHPPLVMPNATTGVYSIHDLELKSGTDPIEFENYFNSTIAPIYNTMDGQQVYLTKGDRGARNSKYSAIIIFDSIEDRNRIYPVSDEEYVDHGPDDLWGPDEIWEKLNTMTNGIGRSYTDYVEIRK